MESTPLASSANGATDASASSGQTPPARVPESPPESTVRINQGVGAGAPPGPTKEEAAAAAETKDPEDKDDATFGFQRAEIGTEPLVGTVHMYERHVVLCYKSASEWPAIVEGAEADRLPKLLADEIKKGQNAMARKTRLTICEGEDGTDFSNGDVLIFPDMIKYSKVTHFEVPSFVEEVLIHDTPWRVSEAQKLSGSFVFVCSHGSRDRRCGVCGPVLIKRFREEIASRGLQGQISVSASSHVGGHKYAGNIIIYSTNLDEEVTGHWYGYVTPEDVPILLDQHIGKREVVDRLWRGQMGLSQEDQKAAQSRRLQLDGAKDQVFSYEFVEATNANGSLNENVLVGESERNTLSEFVEATKTDSNVNVDNSGAVGCCMGSNGTICCQAIPKNEGLENHAASEQETPDIVQEKDGNDMANITKGTRKRGISPTISWFGGWQQEHTYAAVAVVTAIASVVIAYSCYRQLKSK